MAPPPRVIATTFGERGLLVEVPAPPAEVAEAARAIAAAEPALDVGVGKGTLLLVDAAPLAPLRRAEIQACAGRAILAARGARLPPPREHVVPVVYDGPDLPEIAARTGLSEEGVIAAHTSREAVVEVVGFLPGFAYLGGIDPRLVLPRRDVPRRRVEAGSVGLAGLHTGIYPGASPGGWNLLGRAVSPDLFDPRRDPPARFAVGDRVRFERAEGPPSATPPPPAREPSGSTRGVRLDRVAGLATVQDGGRARWLARGVPMSGAIDPVALAAANLAVGNDPSSAGFELLVGSLRLVARGDLLLSIDGEPPLRLRDGDALDVPAGPRLARYVALRGGVEVEALLGGRGTAVAAGLGGHEGRPLRAGDALHVGDDPGSRVPDRALLPIPRALDPLVLQIDLLPLAPPIEAATLEALLSGTFEVSRALDRTGLRLEGPPLPRGEGPEPPPRPVLPGVVQLPPSGQPIVLGPDAAVTGGYPVLGVLRKTSLWSLYRLRPGATVRFSRAKRDG